MADSTQKLEIYKGTMVGSTANFSDAPYVVPFNPTEYSVGKKSTYAEAAIPGLDSPIIQFSHGESRTLSMELLLDTYTYGSGEDVRSQYVEPLEDFLAVDGDLHAPPPCKVLWSSLEFVGFLQDLQKRYTMFLGDGTPVRARVTLSFKEYIPVDTQLASAPRASPDRRKVRLLKRGDSLWQISYDAYGDPALWKFLAHANGIDNPRQLEYGTHLVIPPLPPNPGVLENGN